MKKFLILIALLAIKIQIFGSCIGGPLLDEAINKLGSNRCDKDSDCNRGRKCSSCGWCEFCKYECYLNEAISDKFICEVTN